MVWVFSNRKHLENSSRWLMDLKVSLGTVLDFTNSADQRGRNKRKAREGGREGRREKEGGRKSKRERERTENRQAWMCLQNTEEPFGSTIGELTFLGPDSRCSRLKSQLWKGPSSSFPWPPPSCPPHNRKKKKKDGINISQHF